MPKLRPNVNPSYPLHKQSGQAIVTLSGRDILLGKFDSPESREKYNRAIAEWHAHGRQTIPAAARGTPAAITVEEVLAAYYTHAQSYYRNADGSPTDEVLPLAAAMGPVRDLYASTPAPEFGPLALRAVRDQMIRMGWCRNTINKQICRVRRTFKWAVSHGMVPPDLYHGLQSVDGLKRGRSEAKEKDPVRPVPEEWVSATMRWVSAAVRAMIEVQLLTGARPGEVCSMRGCDIDTASVPWVYRPPQHKTAHHGHAREIVIGPRAEAVIRPFLRADVQAPLFSRPKPK